MLAAAAMWLATGCATTISQLEDARVLGRNEVEVEVQPGLSAPVNLALVDEVGIQTDAMMPHVGGTLGLRVGYREVWLSLELTAMRTSYTPTLLDEEVRMRG